MNNFIHDSPFNEYSEAELRQKKEVIETLPDKMAEYLAKGGKIYEAVVGETNDKYVINQCSTPDKEKAEKKSRVEITISPESADKYHQLPKRKKK